MSVHGDNLELFRVRGRLTGPTGRSEDIDLVVGSNATLLVVPAALAQRLELTPRHSQPVVTPEGRAVWPVAEVRLELEGREITTPCFIGPHGPVLLGAVALGSLLLAVDPVAKRLVPTEGFACVQA